MSLLNILGFLLLGMIALALLFILALYLGTRIPVNRKFRPVKNGIDIYVSTNGVHIDYILPTQNHLMDWTQYIKSNPYQKPLSQYPLLGIGWGAPEFYLELETWDNVPFNLAFRALAIPSPTIMHITGYDELPTQELKVRKISISKDQYLQLCTFIQSSFKRDDLNRLQLIPNKGYTPDDNFYHAHGVYHVFHTCNYWVNKGLKRIGVYAPIWSPMEKGIFYQLEKLEAKSNLVVKEPATV